jgi:hypothetical protein
MTEKHYDILYNGRRLYQNLTLESCSEVLQDLSERFCSGDDIDPNLIELEEIQNGTE